jgi:hypothetical protein
MGVLTVDLTGFGVVMSADSNPIEALDGHTRLLVDPTRHHTRNPILKREAGGFSGYVGYVGTEEIDGRTTRDWLDAFGRRHANARLADYAIALGGDLTKVWHRLRLASVLEILISGVENGEVRFWFVRNSGGLNADGTYQAPKADFDAVNDLDDNYVPLSGQSKDEFMRTHLLSFRQGALYPASQIFDMFRGILETLFAFRIQGFAPMASVEDLGPFARQRLEFVKRLYDMKHGIYRDPVAPIGGKVHVVGVGPDGVLRDYSKHRK